MSGSPRAQSFPSDTHNAEQRLLVCRDARIMATDISVRIAVPPDRESQAVATAEACMAWMRLVDATLSRFQPESELSRLNASAGAWFAASDLLYDAVEAAVRAARASHGLFDPTILPRLEALGYDRDFAEIAHREVASSPRSKCESTDLTPALTRHPNGTPWRSLSGRSLSSWERGTGGEVRSQGQSAAGEQGVRSISLDPTTRRIRLPRGVRIDLGGLAKGWAADLALERICREYDHALINVGGDLRAKGGPQPGESWSAGVFDPRAQAAGLPDRYAAVVSMSRGGLATSGSVRRWWLRDGKRRHHLLDPRTGEPIRLWMDERDDPDGERLIATATALAPTAARAEVAAKVALLRGYPEALRAVEASWARYAAVGPEDDAESGVALLLVLGSGRVVLSANVEAYLTSWGTAGAALPIRIPTGEVRD